MASAAMVRGGVLVWPSRAVAGDRRPVGVVASEAGWVGALRLTTTGRRSGMPRLVVVGYFEDGRDLVTMAMNGWGAAEPAWWLNLQDHPDAIAETRDGARQVRARRAQGEERERLWSRWAEIDKNLEEYAARRPTETAVVVLEPRAAPSPALDPAGPRRSPFVRQRPTQAPHGLARTSSAQALRRRRPDPALGGRRSRTPPLEAT